MLIGQKSKRVGTKSYGMALCLRMAVFWDNLRDRLYFLDDPSNGGDFPLVNSGHT